MRNDIDLRYIPRVRRLIREQRYDIVHFHTKRAHALALWLPRGKQRPKYVVTRRMDYAEPRSRYTDILYNRRVDGVVAVSRAIADVLLDAGVDGEKVRVIASGVAPAAFTGIATTRAAMDSVTVIGCLASLEERKGHRYLLEAAVRLKNDGLRIRCEIAGDGPLRARLEAEAARLGLSDEVRFLGFVSNTAEFLDSVDLVAMPSLHEGLGVAALEAMGAGKPVVATRVGGLAESVLDGATGLLVPARDPVALSDAIAKIVRSPSLAKSMGEQGRERVRQHFSLESMARQNESYYYELLSAGA
jgi:glycosyltransferase involved in cell wall biosynthesis